MEVKPSSTTIFMLAVICLQSMALFADNYTINKQNETIKADIVSLQQAGDALKSANDLLQQVDDKIKHMQ